MKELSQKQKDWLKKNGFYKKGDTYVKIITGSEDVFLEGIIIYLDKESSESYLGINTTVRCDMDFRDLFGRYLEFRTLMLEWESLK